LKEGAIGFRHKPREPENNRTVNKEDQTFPAEPEEDASESPAEEEENSRFLELPIPEADKGNSKTFIEFLYQLKQSFPDKLIILILDNSSIHKSKRVKQFLESNSWVKLQFLTPYSPEYNPIERFWLWLKGKVYGSKSFRTIQEVISKVRKFI